MEFILLEIINQYSKREQKTEGMELIKKSFGKRKAEEILNY